MPLRTVKGMDVRPTTDRTKETLFNIIQFRVPGCRFLDLFAGTGAIGIEALSRGADYACFVEKDRRIRNLVEENLQFTKLIDRSRIINGDALSVLPQLERERPFDIIFMDPPGRGWRARYRGSASKDRLFLSGRVWLQDRAAQDLFAEFPSVS